MVFYVHTHHIVLQWWYVNVHNLGSVQNDLIIYIIYVYDFVEFKSEITFKKRTHFFCSGKDRLICSFYAKRGFKWKYMSIYRNPSNYFDKN